MDSNVYTDFYRRKIELMKRERNCGGGGVVAEYYPSVIQIARPFKTIPATIRSPNRQQHKHKVEKDTITGEKWVDKKVSLENPRGRWRRTDLIDYLFPRNVQTAQRRTSTPYPSVSLPLVQTFSGLRSLVSVGQLTSCQRRYCTHVTRGDEALDYPLSGGRLKRVNAKKAPVAVVVSGKRDLSRLSRLCMCTVQGE
ncbi:hypothetical protein J6590_051158 [Homalodisca vitripennis]|nr:hypothetical protein J6590_051158 [Homalodisca vitripennis]